MFCFPTLCGPGIVSNIVEHLNHEVAVKSEPRNQPVRVAGIREGADDSLWGDSLQGGLTMAHQSGLGLWFA